MSDEPVVLKAKNFRELLAEVERRNAARSRWQKAWHWLVYRLVDRLWRVYLSPSAIRWQATKFCQRRLRGFDDSELWDLDCRILLFAAPRIKRLQEIHHGFPACLQGDPERFLQRVLLATERLAHQR